MTLEIAEGVVVNPGDKLVVTFQRHLSRSEVAQINANVAQKLPGVEVVIVSGAHSTVVVRPAEDAG